MAHEIVNNQFAYVGQAAWHNLGHKVDLGTTGEQMLDLIGLNVKIQTRAIAMRDAWGNRDNMLTKELDEFRAVVRADNNKVFQVVSKRYKPVQNIEIVNFFRDFIDAGYGDMETIGSLRDGAVIWALAKLRDSAGNAATKMNLSADKLEGYLLLATSHDGSIKTIGKPCQTRVVCGNTITLAFGEKTATYSLKHSSHFGAAQKAEAKRVMGCAIEQVQATNELAGKLASVNIDNSDWLEFIAGVVGKDNVFEAKDANGSTVVSSARSSFLDQIIDNQSQSPLSRIVKEIQEATVNSPGSDLASARGTLWGAVNGITYYVDHAKKAHSDENRQFAAWFGPGETMKNKAVAVAVEMAGIQAQQFQRS